MMTLSKQRKFTFNSLLEDIRGRRVAYLKSVSIDYPKDNEERHKLSDMTTSYFVKVV